MARGKGVAVEAMEDVTAEKKGKVKQNEVKVE